MHVVQHAPAARGVNQLMYVGDDQAVEGATTHVATPALVALAVIGFVGWLLLGSRR